MVARRAGEKDPLTNGDLTCDFEGKPLKIEKVTHFSRSLQMSPRVNLPEEPASVTRDPEEIALLVG